MSENREETKWYETEDTQGNAIAIRAVWDYDTREFEIEKKEVGEEDEEASRWDAREVLGQSRSTDAGQAVRDAADELTDQMEANNGRDEDYYAVCQIILAAEEERSTGRQFFNNYRD